MAEKWTYVYSLDGSNTPPPIKDVELASSATVVAGDLLVSSSGYLTKAGNSAAKIVAIAQEAATTATEGDLIKAQILSEFHVIRGTSDADATAGRWAGTTYDLNATTQTLDFGDSSAGCLQIVGVDVITGSSGLNVDCRVVFN
jgi:hypothetical protein